MSSTVAAATSNAKESVAPLRKQALLLEARRDRVEWVEAASCPTKKHRDEEALQPNHVLEYANSSALADEESNDGMNLLRTARVCESMKSAVDVVNSLYNGGSLTPKMKEDRVLKQLFSQVSTEDSRKILRRLDKNDNPIDSNDFSSSGDTAYDVFIQKLRSPEAAEIVQGMRHFVTCYDDAAKLSLEKKASRIQRDEHLKAVGAVYENEPDEFASMEDNEDAKAAAGTIHAYLNLAGDAMKTNVLWKKDVQAFETTSESLETFLYQKCYGCSWGMACDEIKDKEFDVIVSSLQFVTWKHLDIQCLSSVSSMGEKGESVTEKEFISMDALKIPLERLNTINSAWSPSMKLDAMSEVMKSIMDALRIATGNENMHMGNDDILPMLILAIIKARPKNLFSNLQYVQNFSRPDQLRGETGYILTQFQSAVHFLLEVDATSLSIDSIDFEQGLAKCKREIHEHKINMVERGKMNGKAVISDRPYDSEGENGDDETNDIKGNTLIEEIPVTDIRKARLRGEIVNLDWARAWHENKLALGENKFFARGKSNSKNSAKDPSKVKKSPLATSGPSLPPGFTRNYSFLGALPNDVRFSDVPKLLNEYQQLVRTCEIMLKERSALLSAEHKRQIKMARDQLESNALAIEEKKCVNETDDSIDVGSFTDAFHADSDQVVEVNTISGDVSI